MKRPIWEGNISFGLINIPVTLYSAEKRSPLHFHLMDQRNKARIRYDRINAVTGKKVGLKDIVKSYEYEKGNYVIIDQEAIAKMLPQNGHAIEIQNFIDKKELSLIYFEKPYYLSPSKFGNKGYVLLRETLKKTGRVAMAKVMIKTHQYLAAIIPKDNILLLNLLRFPEEIEDPSDLPIPDEAIQHYKISPTEMRMSEKLVNSMTTKWNPKKYRDHNREIVMEWIDRKIRGKKVVAEKKSKSASKDNVVDFMKLLEKSIKKKPSATKTGPKNRKAH